MGTDEIINELLQDVQYEIKIEDNIELSVDEIFDIVNSQFIGCALAVNKRLSFFIPYIGTFVLKNKKAYIKSIEEVQKLKALVSEEQYKEIVKEKRIANANVMNGSMLDTITELEELPSSLAENVRIRGINKLYKEIIASG